MSLLAALKQTPEAEKPPRRWITVIDEEPSIEAPKFELEVQYIHPAVFELILRPYRKLVSNMEMMMLDWPYRLQQEQRSKFLRTFFKHGARNWRGFGKKNIGRLCPDALTNPEGHSELPDVVPFDDDIRDDFALMMDKEYFPLIFRACTEAAEWAVAMQEKKEPPPDGND